MRRLKKTYVCGFLVMGYSGGEGVGRTVFALDGGIKERKLD